MRGSNFYDDVCIVPYRAEWPRRFRLTKQLIIALLLEERSRSFPVQPLNSPTQSSTLRK